MKNSNHVLMDWIWAQEGLHPSEKLVALALLKYRNKDSGLCYPAQDKLMKLASLSRAGVQKALKGLVAKGILHTVGRLGTSNLYYFDSQGCLLSRQGCSLSRHEPLINHMPELSADEIEERRRILNEPRSVKAPEGSAYKRFFGTYEE